MGAAPGGSAVVRGALAGVTHPLPGELHRREFGRVSPRVWMREAQLPPVGLTQLIVRGRRADAENLVGRRRDRTVGHPAAFESWSLTGGDERARALSGRDERARARIAVDDSEWMLGSVRSGTPDGAAVAAR